MKLAFTAYGVPVPQGSMKALVSRTTGRAMLKPGNERALAAWRKAVAWEAKQLMCGRFAYDCALALKVRFVLPRPKCAAKRLHPERKPDLDKMLRAIFDAISGVIVVDDARIVEVSASKQYGEPARAEVEVFVL